MYYRIPEPRKLMEQMKNQDPELYTTLMYEELYEHAQKIFDMHVAEDGVAIIKKLGDIEWTIGDSEFAIDWWKNQVDQVGDV